MEARIVLQTRLNVARFQEVAVDYWIGLASPRLNSNRPNCRVLLFESVLV
jgi:hypothetical protein